MTHAGRVAVVTGGGQGIGAAIAMALAGRGAKVAVFDTSEAAAIRTASSFEGMAVTCDVADRASVDAACAAVEQVLGVPDILVNNAGISPKIPDGKGGGYPAPISELDPAEWARVVGVNLTGAFHLCRRLSPGMISAGRGAIVNQSSVAGKAYFSPVACHYAATKAGLIGLTRHLAGELGPHGITVNAIAPGRIDSPMIRSISPAANAAIIAATPMGRLGTADEVAAMACFLTGPDSRFVTGQTIDVAGGWLMT